MLKFEIETNILSQAPLVFADNQKGRVTGSRTSPEVRGHSDEKGRDLS
ncbi:MAG: hypothetical protein MRZ63_04420 [Anaerostipes sp.]|nr:hypothetical protein [Anaerostipes sp.]